MIFVTPARLARRQIAIDEERTGTFPHLFLRKRERMMASPLALLRGAAPIFYELLERNPVLRKGPPGAGWLVGDAHVENFGVYRAGVLSTKETAASRSNEDIVFDVNDFDDAFIGPWRYDVLRLLTSLVLGGRESGTDGPRTLVLCAALLDSYTSAAFGRTAPNKAPTPPPVIAALIEKVRGRTRKELLDARTRVVDGQRRFVLGTRYEALSSSMQAKAVKAFGKYARRLPKADAIPAEALEVIDAAFRVAGTGSLGSLRIAVLARGKGGPDGAWIFDMKSEWAPSSAVLVPPPDLSPAKRVCAAIQACLARPPRMMGWTRMAGESMFVRRLAPQEDKVDLALVRTEDLEPLARHFGALLGAVHRRGATRTPKRPWTAEDRVELVHRAVALAGTHEAMYLAYCDLSRPK
jgi:uncharacterized protein (DUF2252 family)